jgi:phenylacetate-CoA ligase
MVDPYTSVVSRVMFPLHELLKGHSSVAWRRRLEQSQWLPPAQLQELQLSNLRVFLRSVAQHVPFYRERFEAAGLDVGAIRSVADLTRLPLLGKADIRAHTEALKSGTAGPLTRYNTGGSSGEPLIFFMGKTRKSHDVAAKWRATRWWGVDIGDRELVVWGSPVELNTQDRLKRIRDGLMRSHLLPAFEMSPKNLDQFVSTIRSTRPAMLFGYPSSLSMIARHAQQNSQAMDDLGIKVAFVTSERLYDEQRAVISSVFGCPVANGYGARDAGFIAHECPLGKLHISAEDIVIETVRPDGTPCAAGEAGEIVVTHLATADFPFIRYRTGDVGLLSAEPCACGRGLPVLEEVQGRTTDFVVALDGTVMHGLALIYAVRDLPGVERFKIEQMSLNKTTVKVVAGTVFRAEHEMRIVQDFKARLGTAVDIRVERVDAIANEASGKFRYVVSHVKLVGAVQGGGCA